MKRVLQVLFALLLCPAAVTLSQETQGQWWPELDAYHRFDSQYRLFVLVFPTFVPEESSADGLFGVHLDIGLFPIVRREKGEEYYDDRLRFLRLRFGIRYASTLPLNEAERHEWRGIIDLTPRFMLPAEVLLSVRNRFELRWMGGMFATRYRFRMNFEHDIEFSPSFFLVPYVLTEFFYDSQFAAWNKVRYQAGVTIPIVKNISGELYYCRQNDTHAEPAHVNALGSKLIVNF